VQDVVPDLLKFVTRPAYGLILRFLGFCFIVVGLVAAGLDAQWAGFTPVVWFLLALVAILGVICNLVAQLAVRKTHVGHGKTHKYPETAADDQILAPHMASEAPLVPVAEPEPEKPAEPSWIEVEIYCVKCRDRRTIRDPQTVTLANGRPAYQGPCPVCGTKVTRILKSS